MKKTLVILISLLLFTSSSYALPVEQADLPQAVQNTVAEQKIGIYIRLVDKRVVAGAELYDIEFASEASIAHIVVSENGTIIEDSRKGTYKPPVNNI
ncbi:MAG: hypothetical protein JWN25_2710 [Verrucomicrobiales bacterium]|nr:hypothetical protein [Verrucomicrobiales bacterium]